MKKSYRVFSALAVCSLVLLGACSNNKSTSDQSTSKAKVEQSSKSSSQKSSSSKAQAKSSSAAQGAQSSQGSQEQVDTTSDDSQAASTDNQSSSNFDVAAVGSGDFSSIAGSYTGQNGSNITLNINSDQTGSISKEDGDFPAQFSNFSQSGDVATFTNEYGWTYYVVPAGVQTPGSAASAVASWDDSSKDRIVVIGEGVNVFY